MNNTPFHLHNKIIFITGASSGIGRQIALSTAEMGGKLIITGRDKNKLEETLKLLKGGGHIAFIADLNNLEQIDDLIKKLPKLDGVVMNAGISEAYPIKYLTSQKIQETFNVNYNAVVLLMAGITRQKKLIKGASIVFTSSISSSFPPKGGAMYSGSKAAIENFSKVLALEQFQQKIRSNCITPSMVKTNLYEDLEKTVTKESMDTHIKQYPLGVGFPEDVANCAVFLLSDASRWITGTSIIVDGGFSLNGY